MQKELQLTIWQFILAYKKHSGEQVNYIDFATHSDYRDNALKAARDTGIPQLLKLADAIEQDLLDADTIEISEHLSELNPEAETEESESLLLSEAPAEVWEGKQTINEARKSAAGDEAQPPTTRYAYRLSSALKRSEFSLLHRRALDRFARKHRMTPSEVMAIENETRSKLRLGPLKWEQELASVIKDLRQNHDSIDTLKKQIKNTYVREGRLDHATFLRIYDTPHQTDAVPPAKNSPQAPVQGKDSNTRLLLGLLAGALLLGLIAVATQL